MVKALLAAGADHSKATNKGLSPLHRACALGHVELMQALLGAGADPDPNPSPNPNPDPGH